MAFKLKIVSSWFSEEYVVFKYTTNGIFWKKIYCCQPPFLDLLEYNYTWEPLSFPLGSGNFEYEKEMFSTIEKIKEYEENEWKKYVKGNESLKRQRKEYKEKRLQALRRANK